jgi:hypothetical protein
MSDFRMVTPSKSACCDFGCIRHYLCMNFSNCVSLFLDFLPRRLHSTAMTSWSSLHFQLFLKCFPWLLSKWPLPVLCLLWLLLGSGRSPCPPGSPVCHHVTQPHGRSWAIAFEVVVCVLREEPILEAADNVLVDDVGHGGTCLEETPGV